MPVPYENGTAPSEDALRDVLASHLSTVAIGRLLEVVEQSGLTIREILAKAIDLAWDVQLSGQLNLPANYSEDDPTTSDAATRDDRCESIASLTPLAAPIPPKLAETFGYTGKARFVGFYHEPVGDEVNYDDGRCGGTGEWFAFKQWREHRAVAQHLEDFNFGYSDLEATHWLIVDRELDVVYVARVATAQVFLKGQHPPPPELTPHEIEGARKRIQECIDARKREVPLRIDPAEIQRRMQERQRLTVAMQGFLDEAAQATDGPQVT